MLARWKTATQQHADHMFEEAETPGQYLPAEVLDIISFRYHFAKKYCNNKRVLEIGCGPGLGINLLDTHAAFYVAGEYSEKNIANIKQHHPYFKNTLCFDAHQLPFKDNSFDTLVALAMIYYLNIDKFLAEAGRVLREQGTLFFCSTNNHVAGFVPSPYTTHYYSNVELIHILEQANYSVELYGAFPIQRSKLKQKLYALSKTLVKKAIYSLPNGKNRWRQLRKKAQGQHIILPKSIDPNFDFDKFYCKKLELSKLDKTHRVLYTVATLKEAN